jgi:uncharacterized membrane-anchored protein YjiN (DUF445 family)
MNYQQLNYEEFSNKIINSLGEFENNSLEPHFMALAILRVAEEHKSETTEEIFEEYLAFTLQFCSKQILGQTEKRLQFDKRFLDEAPKTKDFESRYKAYLTTFETFRSLTSSKKQVEKIDLYEQKIKRLYKQNQSGCYIATMAYGSYNHPEVLILRRYRDDKLQCSSMGRVFIKFYYKFSPLLVENLKNKDRINNLLKKALDIIVRFI